MPTNKGKLDHINYLELRNILCKNNSFHGMAYSTRDLKEEKVLIFREVLNRHSHLDTHILPRFSIMITNTQTNNDFLTNTVCNLLILYECSYR